MTCEKLSAGRSNLKVLEGLIQGFSGGLIGLGVLYATFSAIGSQFEQTLQAEMVAIRFFSPGICAAIVGCGMVTGLLGCFSSNQDLI